MERILATALGEDVSQLAAQEKRLLLSRLVARFAHEIRNPLSSLDIHVQLLEEDLAAAPGPLREKTAARLDIIHGELHRLENIVKHFVSLAGSSSLDLQSVDLAKIIHHVCELLRPEAASRHVEIRSSLPETIPLIVADSAQLTQALVNLVINGIQAVEKDGSISVSIESESNEGTLAVEVRDTGPGIPLERQQAIFEPFFTTKPEGSGLGLWIVQQIVTAHGGSIGVRNHSGGGAIFSLRLPRNNAPNLHG